MMRHMKPMTDRAGIVPGPRNTLPSEAAYRFGGRFLGNIQPLLKAHAVLSITHRQEL